ncbi:hypothetical protein BC827DRAFT_1159163 [Russula dissimulans]|nr:hypothetical protein BC827DRAFT_1159163 [Russula dissimulans]
MATVSEDQTQDGHQYRKSPRHPEGMYATPRHLPVHTKRRRIAVSCGVIAQMMGGHRRRANRGRNGRHEFNMVLVLPVPEDCVAIIDQLPPRTVNLVGSNLRHQQWGHRESHRLPEVQLVKIGVRLCEAPATDMEHVYAAPPLRILGAHRRRGTAEGGLRTP